MAGGGDIRIVGGNNRVKKGVTSVTDNAVHVRVTAAPGLVGPIEVRQPVHDLLNCNANIQVGDVDVSALNTVPAAITDAGSGLQASVFVDGIFGFRSLAVTSAVRISNAPTGLDPAFISCAVRDDVLSTVPQLDNTLTHLRSDSLGRLWVHQMGENISTEVLTGGAGDGTPIAVVAITTLHTVPAAPVIRDIITLIASNAGTADVRLDLTINGVVMNYFCPAKETVSILTRMPLDPGLIIQGTAATGALEIAGRVERVNP